LKPLDVTLLSFKSGFDDAYSCSDPSPLKTAKLKAVATA
jgi:hypothetical protein